MNIRKFKIKIDGKIFEAEVEEIEKEESVISSSEKAKTYLTPSSVKENKDGKNIKAPMPGKVIKIFVTKGKKIKEGDVILILEAMKMEQEIKSAMEGKISDVLVSEGETVRKEQILINII